MKIIAKFALTFSSLLGIKILKNFIDDLNTHTSTRNEESNVSEGTILNIIQKDEKSSAKICEESTIRKEKKPITKYLVFGCETKSMPMLIPRMIIAVLRFSVKM